MLREWLGNVEVLREWNNIDILIKLTDVIVCENKVLSKEHSKQLTKYKLIGESIPNFRKTFVYLNPEGYSSEVKKIYINQYLMHL